jgi:hypothetical protein
VIVDMTTDPQAIRARVDAILADLAGADLDASGDGGASVMDTAMDIDAIGQRLEEAHQILVDALESVEKG